MLCSLCCGFARVWQVVNEMYGDSMSVELDDLPLHSSQYHMTEFAKKYFREAQRNRGSVRCSLTLKITPTCFHLNLQFALNE